MLRKRRAEAGDLKPSLMASRTDNQRTHLDGAIFPRPAPFLSPALAMLVGAAAIFRQRYREMQYARRRNRRSGAALRPGYPRSERISTNSDRLSDISTN